MIIHIVKRGENIDSIAVEYGIPVENLIYVNQLYYPYALAVGQALLILTKDEIDEYQRFTVSGGYVYPFVDSMILRETLDFMQEIYVFSYGFTADGNLLPPKVSDAEVLRLSKERGVAAILTLTPFGSDGRFNNELIHELVTNENAVNELIRQVEQTITEKGFAGVDVDFEYIRKEDRDLFTGFVEQMTRAMNNIGKKCSVALAPKTSNDQPGLLYEGKDYAGLGSAADEVLLMTYEWGYKYSEPMAVAPLNKVRQVVEYAATQIPPEKTKMGIPNYGYDWPLPYEKGVTQGTTIGNIQAVEQAARFGTVIEFDQESMSPHYQYEFQGVVHEVWFEDVRSYEAKIELIQEQGLKGFGIWQLMRLNRPGYYIL